MCYYTMDAVLVEQNDILKRKNLELQAVIERLSTEARRMFLEYYEMYGNGEYTEKLENFMGKCKEYATNSRLTYIEGQSVTDHLRVFYGRLPTRLEIEAEETSRIELLRNRPQLERR